MTWQKHIHNLYVPLLHELELPLTMCYVGRPATVLQEEDFNGPLPLASKFSLLPAFAVVKEWRHIIMPSVQTGAQRMLEFE